MAGSGPDHRCAGQDPCAGPIEPVQPAPGPGSEPPAAPTPTPPPGTCCSIVLSGERSEITVTCEENPLLPLLRDRTVDTPHYPSWDGVPVLVGLGGRDPVRYRALSGAWVNSIELTHVLSPPGLVAVESAARSLLGYLAEYQREHDYQFRFGTEVSLNLAQDPELLRLAEGLRNANLDDERVRHRADLLREMNERHL